MVTTVVAITEQSNVIIITKEPRDTLHRHPPRYNSYDQRSHQGLAGGVIGSVLGYELGAGSPIASGLGAAAGSYLGNGMAR